MSQNQRYGRPSNYRPAAIRLAESGRTQPEIAAELGCTNRTLSRWSLQYPEFRAALDRGLARREAERRASELIPLREAATALQQLLAGAVGEPPTASTEVPAVPADFSPHETPISADASRSPDKPSRHPARYLPPEPEPALSNGDPIDLLDPRLGW